MFNLHRERVCFLEPPRTRLSFPFRKYPSKPERCLLSSHCVCFAQAYKPTPLPPMSSLTANAVFGGGKLIFRQSCCGKDLSRLAARSQRFLLTAADSSGGHAVTVISTRRFSVTGRRNMRIVQFVRKDGSGVPRLGAQLSCGADIVDISGVNSTIPNSLVKFLRVGNGIVEEAQRVIASGKSVIPLSEVKLLAPIHKPDKVACVGLNYKGHCDEQNLKYPKEPMFFSKFSSTITGPFDNILLPKISHSVDWEVELAVIIGKEGKCIQPDKAMDYVFGYTVAQDISARDWQKERNNGQFLLGKSMDTFCPLGPAVVTKETIHDPHNLTIKSWVNGKLMQNGNTSELIFKVDFLVAYLSEIVTLYPGDVILTGTPKGVGMHRSPPQFLKKGDVVESEIEGIGMMRNIVV